MKAAFSVWNDRIAPVFDVARHVYLIEVEEGEIVGEQHETLPPEAFANRVSRLAHWGVDVLVCGAISRPLYALIAAYGIEIIPFVAGEVSEIVEVWRKGMFDHDTFLMPGCWRRGHGCWFRTLNHIGKEEYLMQVRGRGGGGGKGRAPQGGRGRMGGPFAAGPGGSCACPQCGYREPHKRGVPCVQQKCPQCGTPLVRE